MGYKSPPKPEPAATVIVGTEDAGDLVADLEQAIESAANDALANLGSIPFVVTPYRRDENTNA